jgi:hypothetical protein
MAPPRPIIGWFLPVGAVTSLARSVPKQLLGAHALRHRWSRKNYMSACNPTSARYRGRCRSADRGEGHPEGLETRAILES